MTENIDVLVVGAGPTGTTLAGDLARRGRRVVVLERRPERHPASRAFATMPRTLELLESRGLAQALIAGGATTPGVDLWNGGRLRLDRVDSPFPFALITPQTHVDTALEQRAVAAGAQVVRGAAVVGLTSDADGVVVTASSAADGTTTTWRATYVVAADGAHSTVRDLLGVPFPGRRVLSSVVLADVRLTHPPTGRGLTVGAQADVFGFLAPYGDGWFRSMTWDRHATAAERADVAVDEVDTVLRRALGRDVGVAEIGWHSRFHSDERQVRNYRHGQVFLAGDAAHVHSPLGGQGMNTGIQDAVNLAWKLDAALGGADDAVLDSYQRERHPVGRRVVFQSGAMLRAVTLRPRPARVLRDTVGSRLLQWKTFSAAVAGSFTGVTLRYPRERGDHRLVGTRAVPVPLQGAPMLARLGDGDWLLVRPAGHARLDVDLPQAERTDHGPALLVRPDGHVAWAGDLDAVAPGWRAGFERWNGRSAARRISRSTGGGAGGSRG